MGHLLAPVWVRLFIYVSPKGVIKRNGIGKELFVMLRFMVDKLRESCPSWRRPRLELLQVCLHNIPLQGRNEMF